MKTPISPAALVAEIIGSNDKRLRRVFHIRPRGGRIADRVGEVVYKPDTSIGGHYVSRRGRVVFTSFHVEIWVGQRLAYTNLEYRPDTAPAAVRDYFVEKAAMFEPGLFAAAPDDKVDVIKIVGGGNRTDRVWAVVPAGMEAADAVGRVEIDRVGDYWIGRCYLGGECIWHDCMETALGYRNWILDLWCRQVDEETNRTVADVAAEGRAAALRRKTADEGSVLHVPLATGIVGETGRKAGRCFQMAAESGAGNVMTFAGQGCPAKRRS